MQAKEASSGAMANLKESLTRLNHYQNIAAMSISEHGPKGLLSGDKHAMQEFFSNSKNVEFVCQAYRLKHCPDNLSRPFFDSALIQLDEVFNARTCAASKAGLILIRTENARLSVIHRQYLSNYHYLT